MGLDAYVEVRSENYGVGDCTDKDEIWYGRKEYAIQSWMRQEFQKLEPNDTSGFNCRDLELTHELINKLKIELITGNLLNADSQIGRAHV